jgi:hypothetical protein
MTIKQRVRARLMLVAAVLATFWLIACGGELPTGPTKGEATKSLPAPAQVSAGICEMIRRGEIKPFAKVNCGED